MFATAVARVVTPAGRASYPYLVEPDTKFDAEGKYKVDLVLDGDAPETQAFVASIRKALDDWKADAAKEGRKITQWNDLPIKEETNENGEPTGNIIVRTARAASGTSRKTGQKWEKPLPLFDEDLREHKGGVGPGSIIKVSADLLKYQSSNKGGVRLSLAGVQVLKAMGGGDDPESLGFGTPDHAGFTPEDGSATGTSGGDF